MSSFRQRLSALPPTAFTLVVMAAAFLTYSCMYSFRKPFTAATYAQTDALWGLSFKSALAIAQVIGYMMSKFIGIKVVSEMKGDRRVPGLLLLILIAELALLGFALTPAPWSIWFMFLNGIPLGMVFGLVFSFLEGRKQTEIMGLGLCASFIFASGFVKDVANLLMGAGVSEAWMPFMTGLVFVPALLLAVWILSLVPPPSAEDEQLRTRRLPMSGQERVAFFRRFAPGLILLILVYMLLTAYRDFRDNFLAEIWQDIRPGADRPNFSQTETPVSLLVLTALMLLVLVRDNVKALMVNHLTIIIGIALTGIAALGFQQGWIPDTVFILMTGFGTYVAYIPFNSILFDRMIAAFRYVSNVGFLIYLADSFGYLGSVATLFYKNFGAGDISWKNFFLQISYILAIAGVIGMAFSWIYFSRNHRPHISADPQSLRP
ncbi:MAG: DUF5690 family protein [Bacteroidia bacterium]|nr:DUF5690 family protein [Bacteroidia bacterium]